MSIKVSVLIGKLGSQLSSRQWKQLRRSQVDFALWTIPAAVLNGLVDFCVRQLALACRATLVEVVHDAYEKSEALCSNVEDKIEDRRAGHDIKGDAEKSEREPSAEEGTFYV